LVSVFEYYEGDGGPSQEYALQSDTLPGSANTETTGDTRISAEATAWYTRSDADRAPYLGQYVAVLNGQVVDHDADQGALFIRIRRRYPNTPVLITEAEARRPREFVIRSPRLERME
jgi:hypothetical protein